MNSSKLLPPAGDPFWIDSPMEVRQIVRDLARRRASVQCQDGSEGPLEAVVTEVRDSGDMVLRFAAGQHPAWLLRGGHSVVVHANLGSARISFLLDKLWPDASGGALAYAARLPLSVHRLQRREFFRVPSPAYLLCELPLPAVDTGGAEAEVDAAEADRWAVPLVDISVGGVCLAFPEETGLPVELGAVLQDCLLELPGLGHIRFGLQLLNRLDAAGKDDESGEGHELLVGARFVGMELRDQMLLQRFLYQLQASARAEAAAA